MELQDVVASRRMVRRYRDEPVDREVIDRITRTALRGPSAGFSQGVRLVVVTDPERRRHIAAACGEEAYVASGFAPWLSVAPVHVLVGVREADYRERYAEPDKAGADPDAWTAPYWWVDAGAALMLLLLAAVDEGLGAGVLDIGDPSEVCRLLELPPDVAPVCLVTIGHPDAGAQPAGSAKRGRKAAAQTIHWERWEA